MKKTNLILISVIAVLLASGVFAVSAYSNLTQTTSKTETNLGTQSVSLQQTTATTGTITDSSASLTSSTETLQSSTSTAVSTHTTSSTSDWPTHSSYYSIQTISINETMSAMNNLPSNANIFRNNDTIRFSGSQITILAIGMMPDDAANMTGMSPPSYATDDVFVIYGLIDPTLVIPSGAHVNLVFANLDDDMYHNYVVTSLAPQYSYMPMQGMMWSNSSSWYGGMMGSGGMMGGSGSNTIFAMMMPVLSPANYNQGIAYYYATSFTLNSYGGSYWYICTYPGHAQGGMYGKILVGA